MTYRLEIGQEPTDDLSLVIAFRNARTGGRVLGDYVDHTLSLCREGLDYGEWGWFDVAGASNQLGGIVPLGAGTIGITVPRDILCGYGVLDNGSLYGSWSGSSIRFRLSATTLPDFGPDFDPVDFATAAYAAATLRTGSASATVAPTALTDRTLVDGVLSFGGGARPRLTQISMPVYPNSRYAYSDFIDPSLLPADLSPAAIADAAYAPSITLNVLPLYPKAATASYQPALAA